MFSRSARVWRRAALAWVLAPLAFCPAAFASSSAYVTNIGGGTVSQFTVAANGTLSPKTPATVATGTGPDGVALSADGKSAYVTNSGGGTVSQFTVAANGTLSPKTPATVATGSDPNAVALSADGKSAYVTNEQREHGFAVHGRGERDAVAQDPGDGRDRL